MGKKRKQFQYASRLMVNFAWFKSVLYPFFVYLRLWLLAMSWWLQRLGCAGTNEISVPFGFNTRYVGKSLGLK
jgi:hypothetical protein